VPSAAPLKEMLSVLRRQLRQRRQVLEQRPRRDAAIRAHLRRRLFGDVAWFWPNDGEPDLRSLACMASAPRVRCWYLPALAAQRRRPQLRFLRCDEATPLLPNGYGIPEPAGLWRLGRPASRLDWILTPLVGFDHRGRRLGMGGGYYDRALASRSLRRHWLKPRIVGVAYTCQQVPQLPARPWDVPLDAVVTEAGWQFFSGPSRPTPP